MGNHHSGSQHAHKPRKNVHWKSAGRPGAPGRPEASALPGDAEPHAIRLCWRAGAHDGGAPLLGYRLECQRVGAPDWLRTQPPLVCEPQLVLSGLEPDRRYRFRVAAVNAVGRSAYSEPSEELTVTPPPEPHRAPTFLRHLEPRTVLENDKTEFRVEFSGAPAPSVAWFKDDHEIFSSRRTAIGSDETSSVLVFHQTLASDEGEIRCTVTNRSGHAVSRASLTIEAPPKLRYPRQYEDGLLYEVNETIVLKTTLAGRPPPQVEWRHDGRALVPDRRTQLATTPRVSVLKIAAARREDRGEYQVVARNAIGEDSAAFLVTVTAPPEPPQRVTVTRQVDRSVTLAWQPPADDGGCRVGNYVVEYFRVGWNVWLKSTTSRSTVATLFDLIEGSEYRFRVKAESPYGMSAPSEESPPVRIPGRPVDLDALAVEARIIEEALARQEGAAPTPVSPAPVSPAPRRKRPLLPAPPVPPPPAAHRQDEFMLVLYPDSTNTATTRSARESFQLDLDSLSPPPLSLSAPELTESRVQPFRPLRNCVSSTELLHEHAMARFYKAVAMQEEQNERNKRADREEHLNKNEQVTRTEHVAKHLNHHIPYKTSRDTTDDVEQKPPEFNTRDREREEICQPQLEPPKILIKTASLDNQQYTYGERQASQDSVGSEHRWQHSSFEDDYTASTVSTDEEYSDEASLDGDRTDYNKQEDTYNPRDKMTRRSLNEQSIEDYQLPEQEPVRPLPLPDPNFIPKPILKKRDVPQLATEKVLHIPDGKQILEGKKLKRNTIFEKVIKMPKQKSFPFPKILNKKEPEKVKKYETSVDKDKIAEKIELNKISDEGKTIIDYYGNIVKEYGTPKKLATPLYLDTDHLKTAAEKQLLEQETKPKRIKKVAKVSKSEADKKTGDKRTPVKITEANSVRKALLKRQNNATKPEIKATSAKSSVNDNKEQKKNTQKVLLKKTERATIVIPIDYQELEKKAKLKVKSAIEYAVDVCLLGLAFWVYLFEDERLAVPVLVLLVSRHVQHALRTLRAALRRLTPPFLHRHYSSPP